MGRIYNSMGFLDIWKNKRILSNDIVSPVTGKILPTFEIADTVFSQEMMGQTIAIIPDDGTIVSPVSGVLELVFPTKHAFGVKTNDGLGFLVHIGIDTVTLKGKGFKSFAKKGDRVHFGQKIIEVDLETLKAAGIDTTVMLIITEKNRDDFKIEYPKKENVIRGEKLN